MIFRNVSSAAVRGEVLWHGPENGDSADAARP